MSGASKAIFLSYASQDAEAAKRIAESLRAAGVEVWFDQNELVGGDAWDQKIRKQISSCALFVPIISASTQARGEGYFRLEWKLAVDRSHLMADDAAFLFPVVIGDITDATARVPDKFREVQWTRLRLDETPGELASRVAKLLSDGGSSSRETGSGAASRELGRPKSSTPPWLRYAWVGVGIIFALAYGLRPLWQSTRTKEPRPAVSTVPTPAAAPLSEARKLTKQAMQLVEDPNSTRETTRLADELCERALKLDAGDAEVWAAAALASYHLVWNRYDNSVGRLEKMRSQATRASQLNPKSVRAALAVACYLERSRNDEEALRTLRELHQRAPEDQQVILSLHYSERRQNNEAAVRELFRTLRALPRTGVLPRMLWMEELQLRTQGRYAEAEVIVDELLADPGRLRGGYYEKLSLLMHSWHELAEAEPFIGKIPIRFQQEPGFGSAIAHYWLWRGEPEKALRALAQVPQDYFEEFAAREPKGYVAGWAHTLAGRPAAAQAEWRTALALVEERLKADGRNFELLKFRALLLALTGQSDAARAAWQLRVELGGAQQPPQLQDEAEVLLALGDPEAAIAAIERGWPQLDSGRRGYRLPILRYDPAFAPIRNDPRVQRIIAEGIALVQHLKEPPTAALQPGVAPAAPAPDDKSVAVLAFANLSDDKENEYFSDGISEELLNVLAKIPGLKVTARTSSFSFKGKQVPLPEIARQLGVAYVIEGSVRKSGDKVRITAQLIKAADGFHVWSENFDRDLKDVFAIQSDVAGRVAAELKVKVMGATKVPTANMAAYQLYQTGRFWWNKRTAAGMEKSIESFQQAIASDPDYAEAHAGLAAAFALAPTYLGTPASDADPKARAAALKALELDPGSAEARAVMGTVKESGYDWSGAETEFREAISLNPNYATAHHWLSNMFTLQGRHQEARAAIRRAGELDPLSLIIKATEGFAELALGRYDQAIGILRQGLELDPNFLVLREDLGNAYLCKGMVPEALVEFRKMRSLAPEGPYGLGELGHALAVSGDREGAQAVLREIDGWRSRGLAVDLQSAKVWLGLGDFGRVFGDLDHARAARENMLDLMALPRWRALHGDPRWPAFLRRMNLAP